MRQMDRETDRWMDGKTEKERQSDRHRHSITSADHACLFDLEYMLHLHFILSCVCWYLSSITSTSADSVETSHYSSYRETNAD